MTGEAVERLGLSSDEPLSAVIWTTTPWTLPANLAIALKPDFDYAIVEHEGARYILANDLVGRVTAKFGWKDYKVGQILKGSQFELLEYQHPFLERKGIFVLGDHVTTDAGTGLVHTAPGHGADDFNIGRKYGLEIYTPVNHRGEFTDDVPLWAGLHVFAANPSIVDLLRKRGALLRGETITHSYPHCWRCKNPIIFRATEQWFISMDDKGLRERALEQIQKVQWHPAWGEDRMGGMVANRPDWCISRQRLWGVPITVLYCEQCSEPIATPELFARVTELFRIEGADAWYEHPPADFLKPGQACAKCGSDQFRKELDILDVWFDSGCSHLAVLKRREELTWPAAVYLEGHDQHRGWFQSSLLVGTGLEGRAPFEQVITCGFVVDDKGLKMSKSLGNVVSPQDVIKQNGGDIVRMWVAMIDYRDDMAISNEIVSRIAEAYRKIRNTARILLANLSDFDPARDSVAVADLLAIDRWILARAHEAVERCRRAYDEYEFHVVYHRVVELCTVDLSALYVDITKDTLYCELPASPQRRSAQTAMYQALRALVGVIAPILSFTAEEIYESMPGLEADIELRTSIPPAALLGGIEVDLATLFIVSHVDFKPAGESTSESVDGIVELEGLGRVEIVMCPARGRKCGRCWKYREEVASDGDLCARCQSVIDHLAPLEMPTA